MKNLLLLSSLLFLTYTTTFAQNTSKLLVGTWKVDIELFKKKLGKAAKKKINKAETEEEKQRIKQYKDILITTVPIMRISLFSDRTMKFKSPRYIDGTGYSNEIKIEHGNWEVINEDKTLILNLEGKDIEFKIITISKKLLILDSLKPGPEQILGKITYIKEKN